LEFQGAEKKDLLQGFFSPHISQVEAAADALSVEAGYSSLYLLRKRQSRCGRIGLPLVNTLCKNYK